MDKERRLNAIAVVAQSGNVDALYDLLVADACILEDIDAVPFIQTPLHIAAYEGHFDLAMELVMLKPSFARKLNTAGFSALHLAVVNNQTRLLRALLNVDSNLVRVKGRGGVTPLHYLVEQECLDLDLLAEFLVTCPECITDVTARAETVLHIAARRNNLEALQILARWLVRNSHKDGKIWKDQVLNWKDWNGNTPLHIAALQNQPQMIKLLLECKVDKNVENLNGLTVRDMLEGQQNNTESVDILRRAGAVPAASVQPKHPTLAEFLRSEISYMEQYRIAEARARKNVSSETRNALLVVTVLILTATYQACLSPPGGISQGQGKDNSGSHLALLPNNSGSVTDLHKNPINFNPFSNLTDSTYPIGKSVMKPGPFFWFYFLNSFAFVASALLTLYILPVQVTFVASSLVFYFLVCYTLSIFVISPTKYFTIYIVVFEVLELLLYLLIFRRTPLAKYLVRRYTYMRVSDGLYWGDY